MTSREIRQQFLDFFAGKQHTIVPSASVVPTDDPTLMFTNAGMNQFKDVFLGTGSRSYTRAADTQKCIRVSGKHNDLEEVGRSPSHHTFFEMLGNWSFGDYFKREAIAWAWELLTEVWGLPKDRLHATVFGGDAQDGLGADEEAERLWKEVTDINPAHVSRHAKKDNFWEMGATGPCGPCSEIHIDLTPDASGAKLVNADDPTVMELWNLVFIQFNRDATGALSELPAKHVDTGMGFERLCRILQNKATNYDADVFTPLLDHLGQITGVKYGGSPDNKVDVAFRVIADHVRMLTFSMADQAKPGNEGRGYVLRRILRRAARFGRQHLDQRDPFIYELVDTLVQTMGDVFPEIGTHQARIKEVIQDEEESFGRTLDRGLALYEQVTEAFRSWDSNAMQWSGAPAGAQGAFERVWNKQAEFSFTRAIVQAGDLEEVATAKRVWNDAEDFRRKTGIALSARSALRWSLDHALVPSEVAFVLYDTHGFPIDMTQQMAAERGLTVDVKGFEQLMEEARAKARAAAKTHAEIVFEGHLPATDESPKYESCTCTAKVLGWVEQSSLKADGRLTDADGEVGLVLDRTSFYAEKGGQVGDAGTITTPTGTFDVDDTIYIGDGIIHVGHVGDGYLQADQQAQASVDPARDHTRRNHTATHLAHWALRQVLGDEVTQQGSLVDDTKLRFDFDHRRPMSRDQIEEVEKLVNERIYHNLPVATRLLATDQAQKLPGVRAFFGEKYGDEVRVVEIGDGFSREFCGGTHLASTGEVGFFKIVSEEAVAKGVRRMVAVTGREAIEYVLAADRHLREAANMLNTSPDQLAERVAALQKEIKDLKKKAASGAVQDIKALRAELADNAEELAKGRMVVAEIPDVSVPLMRELIDWMRARFESAAICVASRSEAKAILLASFTDDLVAQGMKAGDLVRQIAPIVGGSGGGKPTLAQAGGKNPDAIPQALDKAREMLREMLS